MLFIAYNGTCRKGNTSILYLYDHCINVTYIHSGSKPSVTESIWRLRRMILELREEMA